MVKEDAAFIHPLGRPVIEPAERVGHGLGFVEIVEAGEVAPAGIAAQLDETGAEHDAEEQPAKHPDGDGLRDEA